MLAKKNSYAVYYKSNIIFVCTYIIMATLHFFLAHKE